MVASEAARGGSNPPLPASCPRSPAVGGSGLMGRPVPVRVRPRVHMPASLRGQSLPLVREGSQVRLLSQARMPARRDGWRTGFVTRRKEFEPPRWLSRATHRCAALSCKQRLLGSIPRLSTVDGRRPRHARVAQRQEAPRSGRGQCAFESHSGYATAQWCRSSIGQSAGPSSRRQRVRFPSAPHAHLGELADLVRLRPAKPSTG